jgi:HTH-type transcriptional regulator / antitoxin HigA
MNTRIEFQPDYAIHPGETLAETLEELGMSQAELAERTGRPLKTINEIVQGKAAITADTALQLERATGVPASFWNNAQRNYEAALARNDEAKELERQLAWLRRFPVKPLVKCGWVQRAENELEQMRHLLNFFGVAGVSEWERIWQRPQAAFRKSAIFESHPMAVAAWLRQGERLAQHTQANPFHKNRFMIALERIRELTTADPKVFEPEIKRLCAEAGAVVVFVPEVPGARAYGATRWLAPDKAILQLSLRGKADDFLWFTFFHEAAHILKHGKKDVFIEAPEQATDKEGQAKEEQANNFAAEFLIPSDIFRDFRSSGVFTRPRILAFARTIGIAPGIVVGRLQHEGLIEFKQYNDLKRRFCFAADD